MNNYVITAIDLLNKIVRVVYTYNAHTLTDLVPVSDPNDTTIITDAINKAYAKYKLDMDTADALVISPSVETLIGQTQGGI